MVSSQLADALSNAEAEVKRRDFLKCCKCRSSSKKCEPRERVWTSFRREKCNRCSTLGHECGPPERASVTRRRGRLSSMGSSGDTGYSFPETSAQILMRNDDTAGSFPGSPLISLAIASLAVQYVLLRFRQDLSRRHRMMKNSPAFLHYDFLLQEASDRMVTFCTVLLQPFLEGQEHTPDLGALYYHELRALQLRMELLRLHHLLMNHGAGLHSQVVNKSIPVLCYAQNTTELGRNSLLQCAQGVLRSRSSLFGPKDAQFSPTQKLTVDEYRQAHAAFHERLASPVACSAILNDAPLTPNAGLHIAEAHMAAGSGSLTDSAETSHPIDKLKFPAAHLAYLNGDTEPALDLDTEQGRLILGRDGLGRTLLHLGTEAGDIPFLKQIADMDQEALVIAGVDNCGHNCLDIPAIQDDSDTFGFVLDRTTHFPALRSQLAHENLLNLAVVCGSKKVVSKILREGTIALPPYTVQARMAIEHGFEEVARLFLPYLDEIQWTSKDEIDLLARLAQDQQMHGLATELRIITPIQATAEMALASLAQGGPWRGHQSGQTSLPQLWPGEPDMSLWDNGFSLTSSQDTAFLTANTSFASL